MNYKNDFFIVLYWDIDYENGQTEIMAKSIGLNKYINIEKSVLKVDFIKGHKFGKSRMF